MRIRSNFGNTLKGHSSVLNTTLDSLTAESKCRDFACDTTLVEDTRASVLMLQDTWISSSLDLVIGKWTSARNIEGQWRLFSSKDKEFNNFLLLKYKFSKWTRLTKQGSSKVQMLGNAMCWSKHTGSNSTPSSHIFRYFPTAPLNTQICKPHNI